MVSPRSPLSTSATNRFALMRSLSRRSTTIPSAPKNFGTGKVEESILTEMVRANFPLTPKAIIDHLKLRRPIYRKTAAYGHFGRTEDTFTWEALDKVEALKAGVPVAAAAR